MTAAGGKLFLELPLLKRELVGLLRTRRAFWLLVGVVALSSLLPLLAWPTGQDAMIRTWQNVATLQTFFMAQLTLALLAIPAFTAGAISGERERETYEMLYSTLLSPISIIFSKALASAGYVLVLLLASAPSVCVLYLLGGISFETILKCYAVIFAWAATSALICLKQSMRSRRTAHAVVRGVLWVAFWNGGLLIILFLAVQVIVELFDHALPPVRLWSILLMGLSPYSGITVEIYGHGFSFPSAPGTIWEKPWILNLIYAGAVSASQLFYLLRKVRTPEVALSRRRERRLLKASRPGRPIRRSALARALIVLGDSGFPLLENPVFLKEVRSEFFSRPWYRRILFWGPLALFITFILVGEGHREMAFVISIAALILICLVAPGIAASALPREIEQGNLDLLRGTLLPLGTVLRGKFLASLYGSFGIVAAVFGTILGFFLSPPAGKKIFGADDLWSATVCLSVIFMTYLFVNSLATFVSAISRRTVGALVISYLTILAVFLGWPFVLELVFPSPRALGDGILELLCATSPFITIIRAGRNYFSGDFSPGWTLLFFLVGHGLLCIVLWAFSGIFLARLRARDR